MKDRRQQLLQVAGYVLCAVVAWKFVDLEGTELYGGSLTHPLVVWNGWGAMLFVVPLILTFFRPRIAAITVLVPCALCLPLWFYLTYPGLVQRIVPGNYTASYSLFVWDGWALTEILALALLVYISSRHLFHFNRPK